MFGDLKRHSQIKTTFQGYALFEIGGMEKFFVDKKLRAVDVIAVNAVNLCAENFLPNSKPWTDATTNIDDGARVNEFGNERQNCRRRFKRAVFLSTIKFFVVSLIAGVNLFAVQMNSSLEKARRSGE